ncbi:hypothetical protein CROQUDRAFT_654911 [Cronartium quercuum f. sp. fusiforme G11]|uniref:Cyclin n=1 Tax=Cronartium quercuum f. sp. fusiforme G11 TaxID=708437 RepID=A0A9P6NMR6_9BASI|nr:hypothetical protein CROQUDRAFT_654911 [Cronartium quercuum f. sp. fusiforme G11]
MPSMNSSLNEFCQTPLNILIDRISSKLRVSLSSNHQSSSTTTTRRYLSRFQANHLPTITIQAYLTRLVTLTPISIDALLLGLLYLNRAINFTLIPSSDPSTFSTRSSTVPYHSLTIHRLLLTSLIIANKFISDHFLSATRASKVGGIPLDELAGLERTLLECIGFNLYFSIHEINHIAHWVLNDDPNHSILIQPRSNIEDDQNQINEETNESKDQIDEGMDHSKDQINERTNQSKDQFNKETNHSKDQIIIETNHSKDQITDIEAEIKLEETNSRISKFELTTAALKTKPKTSNIIEKSSQTPQRKSRVFTKTHFISDPNLNSNYLTKRPIIDPNSRIIITNLNNHILNIKTELIGIDQFTGQTFSKLMSSRSYHHSISLPKFD